MSHTPSSPARRRDGSPPPTTLGLLLAYAFFGALHELAHHTAAWRLLPSSAASVGAVEVFAASIRATLGRYSIVQLPASCGDEFCEGGYSTGDEGVSIAIIVHSGWLFSLLLAVGCHYLHVLARGKDGQRGVGDEDGGGSIILGIRSVVRGLLRPFVGPTLPLAAYVTAIEAMVTDLLGFVPVHPHLMQDGSSSATASFACFCGNFGILLLNPSWVSSCNHMISMFISCCLIYCN